MITREKRCPRDVVRAPTPPPIIKRVVERAPTPEAPVMERVWINYYRKRKKNTCLIFFSILLGYYSTASSGNC
jgi:hypothetical protein